MVDTCGLRSLVVVASKAIVMKVISSVMTKADGANANVVAVCAEAGMFRQFFYHQQSLYRAFGIED